MIVYHSLERWPFVAVLVKSIYGELIIFWEFVTISVIKVLFYIREGLVEK